VGVHLRRELVDLLGELGVDVQLTVLFVEVVVRLLLGVLALAVLTDHHERRQEDGFQRHDEGQGRPRALLATPRKSEFPGARRRTCH